MTRGVRLTLPDGDVLTGVLDDTAPGRDLASLLPLRVDVSDFHATEKVADLPRPLDLTGTPTGTAARAGDLMHYAPWADLAFFYRDSEHAEGLVRLGSLEDGAAERLAALDDGATRDLTAA